MLQPHPPFVFSRHLLVILIIFSVAFVLLVPYFIFFLHLLISNKPAKQSSQEEAEQNSQHWVVFNHFRLSKGVFNGLLMGKLANWSSDWKISIIFLNRRLLKKTGEKGKKHKKYAFGS
jgi:hypothetical protein